jgi:hypothetical protein
MSHNFVGYFFVSLGCNQETINDEPSPWCFLDDTIYEYERNDCNLDRFHETRFSRSDQREVIVDARTGFGYWLKFRLKVQITSSRIFGQQMFVVDVDHENLSWSKPDKSLGVPPETTMHEKILGLFIENKQSVDSTHHEQGEIANR